MGIYPASSINHLPFICLIQSIKTLPENITNNPNFAEQKTKTDDSRLLLFLCVFIGIIKIEPLNNSLSFMQLVNLLLLILRLYRTKINNEINKVWKR